MSRRPVGLVAISLRVRRIAAADLPEGGDQGFVLEGVDLVEGSFTAA